MSLENSNSTIPIKKIRIEKGISQKQLAKSLNIDSSLLSKYESGKIIPSPTRVVNIASHLGVNPDDLLKYIANSEKIKTKKHQNNEYLNRLVLLGAQGKCELCKTDAPFNNSNGHPYLIIYELSKESNIIYPEKNMVALCPNCEARVRILKESNVIKKLKEIAQQHSY